MGLHIVLQMYCQWSSKAETICRWCLVMCQLTDIGQLVHRSVLGLAPTLIAVQMSACWHSTLAKHTTWAAWPLKTTQHWKQSYNRLNSIMPTLKIPSTVYILWLLTLTAQTDIGYTYTSLYTVFHKKMWQYIWKIWTYFNNFYISGNRNECPLQVSYLLIHFVCDINMTSLSHAWHW